MNGLPVDPEVAQIIAGAGRICGELGADVDDSCVDLSDAMDIFQVQRAAGLATLGNGLDRTQPDWKTHAKDTAVWNIEKGQALTAPEILDSELKRAQLYARVVEFFADYDALLLPAAQVPPFPITTDWVRTINDIEMPTYIDWMTVCCAITATGLPAISVPAGFTAAGLPVGVQIVGKPRGDLELLRLAHAFEQTTQHYKRQPDLCAV